MRFLLSKVQHLVRVYLVPTFLLGREKAVAAAFTPLIVGGLLSVFGYHVPLPIVEQVVLGLITSFTVHQTVNT
jgi:hypothetical protein